jgi:hypothetical protein
LRQFYDEGEKWKAMRTARTEVGAAAGQGQREAAAQSGYVTKKQWIATMDDRVRDAHGYPPPDGVANEIKDFNEPYSNGLMNPGDTSTGDTAQFINCRCAEGYIVGPKSTAKPVETKEVKPISDFLLLDKLIELKKAVENR